MYRNFNINTRIKSRLLSLSLTNTVTHAMKYTRYTHCDHQILSIRKLWRDLFFLLLCILLLLTPRHHHVYSCWTECFNLLAQINRVFYWLIHTCSKFCICYYWWWMMSDEQWVMGSTKYSNGVWAMGYMGLVRYWLFIANNYITQNTFPMENYRLHVMKPHDLFFKFAACKMKSIFIHQRQQCYVW